MLHLFVRSTSFIQRRTHQELTCRNHDHFVTVRSRRGTEPLASLPRSGMVVDGDAHEHQAEQASDKPHLNNPLDAHEWVRPPYPSSAYADSTELNCALRIYPSAP